MPRVLCAYATEDLGVWIWMESFLVVVYGVHVVGLCLSWLGEGFLCSYVDRHKVGDVGEGFDGYDFVG